MFIDDPEVPGALFALFGILGFVLFAGFAAAHVVLGWLVGSGRGRVFQTIFAVMQLLSFPLGTAYAIYALWVCWGDERSVKAFETSLKPGVT